MNICSLYSCTVHVLLKHIDWVYEVLQYNVTAVSKYQWEVVDWLELGLVRAHHLSPLTTFVPQFNLIILVCWFIQGLFKGHKQPNLI